MYPFLLVFLVFLFFLKIIFLDQIFFLSDFEAYFYPIRHLWLSFIKLSILPFWNPYIDLGVPFLADLQTQGFYPPSIFFIFGLNIGFKLFIIFHFILSALGFYILANYLGLPKYSSFLSSFVWTFSGFFVSSIDIPIVFSSLSWLPLIFYFWLKGIDSLKYIVFSGIFLGIMFLGGEPAIFYGTIICLFLHSLYIAIFERIYRIKRFILVVLIGISLTLFQAIPFLEFFLFSTRTSFRFYDITQWSFAPYEILRFIIPYIFGSPINGTYEICKFFNVQPWLESPYIGIIPFVLLLTSLRERSFLFFLFLFIFSLILSFGRWTPLYDILSYLPFFGFLRYPVKFLFLATFAGSILIGFAFSRLVEKKIYFKLFFIFAFVFSSLTIFFIFEREFIFSFFKGYARALFWIDTIIKDSLFLSLVLLFSSLLIFLFKKERIKKNLFIAAFVIIAIFDIFFFQERLCPTTSSEIYEIKPKITKFIKDQTGIFRIYITPRTKLEFMEPIARTHEECFLKRLIYLMPNLGLMDKIFYISGYRSIVLRDYAQFVWTIEVNDLSFVLHLLSLINGRYVIVSKPLNIKGLKLIFKDPDGPFLYENTSFLERAFFVSKYKVIKDRIKRLEYMIDRLNPKEEIVLEEEVEKVKSQKVKSNVKIIKYEPNRVAIEVEAEEPGFLFLSDTYYPGWKAYVKKEERKIYKANHCFRAVWLDRGHFIVEFRYIPKVFYIGTLASIVSFLLIIGAFIF